MRVRATLPVANAPVKARTVIGGMLAGADSIDDLDVLRSGGTTRVIGEVPQLAGTPGGLNGLILTVTGRGAAARDADVRSTRVA